MGRTVLLSGIKVRDSEEVIREHFIGVCELIKA